MQPVNTLHKEQLMKTPLKIVLSLAVLASLSFADATDAFQKRYDEAIQLYNAHDYIKAYDLFNTLWELSPEDAEVNFYLGRSALELKQYNEAGIAFDRVLMINPKHTRTRLEMARLYFETKQYEAAQRELDGTLGEELPQNVQGMVASIQKAITQQQSKHTLRGALMLALDYDTNIANDVGRGVTQNAFTSTNDTRKSVGLAEILVLNHAYDMGEKGGWAWESNFLAYNKTITRYSDRNILLFSLASGPTYTFDTYKLSFLGSYDTVDLGSDPYLGTSGLSINLKKIISPTLMAEADISQKRTIYDAMNSTSDFDSTIYTLGIRKSLGDNSWLLSTYLSYKDDKERAKDATQYGVSKNEWAYKMELSKEFAKDLRGLVAYTYKDIDYDEYDSFLLIDRKDKENYYNIGLTYAIDKQSSLLLNYSYTDHNSNNALGQYTKNVTSLAYMRNF